MQESYLQTQAWEKANLQKGKGTGILIGGGVTQNAHTSAFLFPPAIFKASELMQLPLFTAGPCVEGLCVDPGSTGRKRRKQN